MKFKIIEKVKRPENYDIMKYKFNMDGTLDVFEDVELSYRTIKKLPFKFGKVVGDFNCSWNKLTSLEGFNLNGIFGKIYVYGNPNLKLIEKEELWATLNPGRLILEI